MKAPVTLTAGHLRMAVQFAAQRGLDVPRFLSWLRVEPAVLTDPDARVMHETFTAALDEIPRRVHAPDLGLELAVAAGERLPHADMGVLAYVANSSATVGDAFAAVIRFLRVVHDGAAIRLEVRGDDARVYLRPLRPIYLPRHAREFMLASILQLGRRISGRDWDPRVVRFEHEAPPDTALHRKIFRAPLEFAAGVSEMLFERTILDLPVTTADPALHEVMARYAEKLIERLPRLESATDHVRQAIAQRMRDGIPDIARVAAGIGTSVRSLQRTLSAEGLTYRGLVDDVRRELALRYVEERRLTMLEIAFILGFSDSTAFHRAFRRWTGRAPGDFRRAQRDNVEGAAAQAAQQ